MNILMKETILNIIVTTLPTMKSVESSDDSSSSDEDLNKGRQHHVRIKSYVHNIVNAYTDLDFKSHFRMHRTTVSVLIQNYGVQKSITKGGWPKVSVEKVVLMTVWYLSNTETFREVSDRFGITTSCCYNSIVDYFKFLILNSHNYIKWPNQNEAALYSREFHKKRQLTNVIGAIDGSHIRINRPRLHQEDYYNRKSYHSIIIQAVATYNLQFIDVYIGEAGSMHDARVLRKSNLYQISSEQPATLFYNTYHLLGDSAYPVLPWLLPPHKDNGHLTDEQRSFNYNHSSTRMVVEHAFGLLKQRFRRLQKFCNYKINFIINATFVCCILHNICLTSDDTFDENFYDSDN